MIPAPGNAVSAGEFSRAGQEFCIGKFEKNSPMPIIPSFLSLAIFAGSLSDSGHRRILLLAPDETNTELREQQHIFHLDTAGLQERDIVVSVITPISDRKTYYAHRKQGQGFLFVLYGKDGGEKFTSEKPVSLYQLYGIIDAMPMRTEEIKKKKAVF